jgi:hypothetical protein
MLITVTHRHTKQISTSEINIYIDLDISKKLIIVFLFSPFPLTTKLGHARSCYGKARHSTIPSSKNNIQPLDTLFKTKTLHSRHTQQYKLKIANLSNTSSARQPIKRKCALSAWITFGFPQKTGGSCYIERSEFFLNCEPWNSNPSQSFESRQTN